MTTFNDSDTDQLLDDLLGLARNAIDRVEEQEREIARLGSFRRSVIELIAQDADRPSGNRRGLNLGDA